MFLFIVGHLQELPVDLLGLLPVGIRRRLLLMLPILNICKLEGTSVTDGIAMDDEIWKLRCSGVKFKCFYDRYTSSGLPLTWKECFFQVYLLELNAKQKHVVTVNIPELRDCYPYKCQSE